ncbi:MAG: di-trans,poly-cis-decaprenylcistransferase [Clostridia bacterium]|nr:di-trans,poly-cis-decaprenylcistransferase [Clostridia bacterium]
MPSSEDKKLRHVGFIMDGNGRWAKRRNKPRTFGHKKGADAIIGVLEECFDSGVEVVSLYAFSTENWSRPKEEIDAIFDLLSTFLKKYSKKLFEKKSRLLISGDLTPISKTLRERCEKLMADTAHFTEHVLNIALNYGSRNEIVRAVNLLKDKQGEISEEDISNNLYTKGLPDIDLVVRTSGEKRLSNFFLWQCAYAEFYFTDVLWPDFNKEETKKALDWFYGRKRRFGGIENA